MPFLTQYQIIFKNNEEQNVTINISDTTSGAGTPDPIPLKCTGAELKIVDSDEDKFSVIKGKRIEFSFLSTLTENLTTFTAGPDNQWLVEVLVGATQIFSGYLVTDATRESFLPPTTYTVELTASDNLGLLKDEPLTKPDGTNPRGKFRLMDYISWCLAKTGFDLPFKVVYNLRPEELTAAGSHTFHEVYLDAKTFEADINESIDCYQVLQRILKGCFLTQHNNAWWIIRVDEMNGTDYHIQDFDPDGTIGGPATNTTYSQNIGITESIKLINKDAEVMPERANKLVETTLRLELPREIPDNKDFNRGTTWVSPYVVNMAFHIYSYATLGAFPVTGEFEITYLATGSGIYYKWTGVGYAPITGAEVPQGFAYNIEDWTLVNEAGGAPTISAYVIKVRRFGAEIARYVELSTGGGFHWIKSNRIPVGRYDKMTFSVDRRYYSDLSGSGLSTENVAQIRLFGEDGTYWTVTNIAFGSDPAGSWVQCSASFTTNQRYITDRYVRNEVDTKKWMPASVDANPVPVGGEIEILLRQMTATGTMYSNLQFEYHPYVNDNYQDYTAQKHKVSQALNTKATIEEDVYTGDLPRPLYKGAMFIDNGPAYSLTRNWYNYNAGTSGELAIASFGKYQAFEYWNQHRRIIRKFQGTLRGMDTVTPTDIPGLLHQYTFTAATDHSTNKTFMLLSYSQNLDTCEWTGIFAEVLDSVDGKDYASDHEFKYSTDEG